MRPFERIITSEKPTMSVFLEKRGYFRPHSHSSWPLMMGITWILNQVRCPRRCRRPSSHFN